LFALQAVRQTADYEARHRKAVAVSRRTLDITEQALRKGTIQVVRLVDTQGNMFESQEACAAVRLLRSPTLLSPYKSITGSRAVERAAPVAKVAADLSSTRKMRP
jgi:outer membrane protein TolC